MRGLSLEEINELFGDPVAVHITHHDKVAEDDLEKRLEEYNVNGLSKRSDTVHVEDSHIPEQKRA